MPRRILVVLVLLALLPGGAAPATAAASDLSTAEEPCLQGRVTPFGETDPAMTILAAEPPIACRSLDLDAGRHAILPRKTNNGPWTLLDADGRTVCARDDPDLDAPWCDVPTAGVHRLLVEHPGQDVEPAGRGLRDRPGVQRGLSLRGRPVVGVGRGHPGDRQPCAGGLPADRRGGRGPDRHGRSLQRGVPRWTGRHRGDRRSRPAGVHRPRGHRPRLRPRWAVAVPGRDLGDLAPIRSTLQEPYRFAVRSLDPIAGCPLVEASPLGTPVADLPRGHGCWQYDAVEGRRFLPLSAWLDGATPPRSSDGGFNIVLDSRFERGCDFYGCQRPFGTERITVLRSVLGGDLALGVYHPQDPVGCRPSEADLTTTHGRVAAAELLCLSYDEPRGTGLMLAVPPGADNALVGRTVTWFDAAGETMCDTDYVSVSTCRASGPGPYHAVVGRGPGFSYAASAMVYDDFLTPPDRCVDVPVDGQVELRFAADGPARCLATAANITTEEITVERTSGEGRVLLMQALGTGQCRRLDGYGFSERSVGRCEWEGSAPGRRTMLLTSDGTAATFRVSRTEHGSNTPDPEPEPEPQPPGTTVRNLDRPLLRGVARVGRTVRVTRGRWTPAPSAYRFVWQVGARRLPGLERRRLRLRPFHRGKRIRVHVVAGRSGAQPGVAVTRTVTVRRRR